MNFLTSTKFKRKYFLRQPSLNRLKTIPKLEIGELQPFRDMLIIGSTLPSPFITPKTFGFITSHLIHPKADYTRINLSGTTLMHLKEETYNIKYALTQQEFLYKASTSPLFLDTSGIIQTFKPKLTQGNPITAQWDYLNTVFNLAVEPYNTTVRVPILPFEIPETLPNSISEIQRLIKLSDKALERRIPDIKFLPFLYLIKRLIDTPFDSKSFITKDDIGLMFYGLNNAMVVNLFDLIRISKLYDEVKGVTKTSEIEIIKLILSYILDLHNLDSTDIDKALSEFTPPPTSASTKSVKITPELKQLVKDKTENVPDLVYIYKSMNLKIPENQIINTRKAVIDMKPTSKLDKETLDQFKLPTGTRGQESDTGNAVEAFNVLQAREYHQHIERAITALNASGYVVKIKDKKVKQNVAEDYTEYVITIKPLSGATITQRLIVPNIDETSAIKQSGNRYVIRKQKHDAPIRKIKKNRVVISSHYSKMFLIRGEQASNSHPAKIRKFIQNKYANAVQGDFTAYNVKLPFLYEQIGSAVKSFIKDDVVFVFDYPQRETPQVFGILKKRNKTLKGVELNRVVVGAKAPNTLYYVDFNDNIIVDDGKSINVIAHLKDYLELPPMSPTFITTKVMGTRLPLVAILMRYYTIEQLFALMDVEPREIKRPADLQDEWMLKFQDRILAFPNSNVKAMILLSGLNYFKNMSTLPYEAFKDVKVINDILADAGVSLRVQRELLNLFNLFIDPLTLDVLTELHQPTTFQGILLYVVDLLKDDYVNDVNTVDGFVLQGSSRISGLIYNMLSRQIASNVHHANLRRHSLQISPYELRKELSADPTIMPEDDINPISYEKNRTNVTILGKFARTPDTVDMKAREFHPTATGIESEATKESGNVGMDFYLSASSQLSSMSGVLKPIPEKQIDYSNIFSSSAMLALFSESDDGKRTLFTSVQNAHVIPSALYQVLPVLTGYDYIYPYKVGKLYALHAKEKGKVVKLTKTSIDIKYKDKTTTYYFKDWYGKQAGGRTYVHRMKTNLVLNDTVDVNDCIYFDSGFFGVDIFNRKHVVYKAGALCYVMLTEGQEVYEDSCALSEDFANRNTVEKTYLRDVVVQLSDDIDESVKVGDKVEYNDILIQLGFTGGAGLSSDLKDVLANIEMSSPKAKHIGKVEHIEIYYNDIDSDGNQIPMSKSIQTFIAKWDREMVRNKGFKGRVDSTFSHNGKPLQEGELLIIFYITKHQKHLIGSKIIFANQLKATPATTFPNSRRTENGKKIDAMFGQLSVDARIVPSFKQIIALSTLTKELSAEVIRIWDN